MKYKVDQYCFSSGEWVYEFTDYFATRKEAMGWIDYQVSEWKRAMRSGSFTDGFKSGKWIVYRNDKEYYKYSIKKLK